MCYSHYIRAVSTSNTQKAPSLNWPYIHSPINQSKYGSFRNSGTSWGPYCKGILLFGGSIKIGAPLQKGSLILVNSRHKPRLVSCGQKISTREPFPNCQHPLNSGIFPKSWWDTYCNLRNVLYMIQGRTRLWNSGMFLQGYCGRYSGTLQLSEPTS